MHNLSQIDTDVLIARFEELQSGPLHYAEVHGFYCGCDEDCAYDSLDAVEGELVLRAMAVAR